MPSSPLLKATSRACIISAASSITAQAITSYRTNTALTLDWTALIHFALFSALSTPPNFLWQSFLEASFPSHTTARAPANAAAEEKRRKEGRAAAPGTRLNKTNLMTKQALDMTFGALINTIMFIAVMSSLRGASTRDILASVRRDTWPLLVAGLKLWPAVSLICFAVVRSVEMRSLLGNLVGFGWNIYLCLFASGP